MPQMVEPCTVGVGGSLQTKDAPSSNRVLQTSVEQALRATGLSLLNIHVCVAEGILMLRGVVPTYHVKQIAQNAAMRVAGISEVHNEIGVASFARH